MAIFGTTPDLAHNGTSVDILMNYTYSILLLTSLPLAFFLNPIVFYYNFRQQQQSLVTRLFQMLAVADFIMIIRTVSSLYNLLKPQQEPLYILNASVSRRIVCSITYTTGFSSMSLTLLLCIVRFIMIRFPFGVRAHRLAVRVAVCVALAVDVAWNFGMAMFQNFTPHSDHIWFSPTQTVWQVLPETLIKQITTIRVLSVVVPFYVKIGLSVVFSLLTVRYLRSEDAAQLSDIKRRSINTIVLLNMGNIVWFAASMVAQMITQFKDSPLHPSDNPSWKYWYFYIQFLEAVIMQSVLIAYNPLVICCRSTGIRAMLGLSSGQGGGPREISNQSDYARPPNLVRRTLSSVSGKIFSKIRRNQGAPLNY